jgi:DNA mismatch endonuclease (patch repair protein)
MGFTGYRLHRKDLPGKPDVAFIGKRKAIKTNGCFWHGHDCKEGTRKPKSNIEYWIPKIERTRERDIQQLSQMEQLEWDVLTLWECEFRDIEKIRSRLWSFMNS